MAINKREKTLLKLLIAEQLAAPQPTATAPAAVEQPKQLIPLTPQQIESKSTDLSNKFTNNIFTAIKDSLGDEYYDQIEDLLNKNVKIKQMLSNDFKTFVSKAMSMVAKQPTGNEKETAGGNKTNVS